MHQVSVVSTLGLGRFSPMSKPLSAYWLSSLRAPSASSEAEVPKLVWTSTAEAGGHVRRGGGYQTTDPDACGADYGRGEDSGAVPDRGFRCVKDL